MKYPKKDMPCVKVVSEHPLEQEQENAESMEWDPANEKAQVRLQTLAVTQKEVGCC